MKTLFKISIVMLSMTLLISIFFSTILFDMAINSSKEVDVVNNRILINAEIDGVETMQNVSITSLKIFIFCIIFIVMILPFLKIYIFSITTWLNEKSVNKRITNENIIYQRELPVYNSAIASYIIDAHINPKRDFKGLVVELETKGIIVKNSTDNYYQLDEIKYQKHQNELGNSENYVIDCATKKTDFNKKQLVNAIITDAERQNLVTSNPAIIILSLLFALFTFNFFGIIVFIILSQSISFKPYYYRLSNLGREEKDKMIKLKSFLTNFSDTANVKSQNANIYDRYLAFSISLNVNKKY